MNELRERLGSSGATSAGPYGYTLTIWGSGMVSAKELGSPGVVEILLLVAGAVGAFVAVEALVYRDLHPRAVKPPRAVMALWGNAHLPAAGGAIVLVWAADRIIAGGVAWPVAGFLATVTYLVVSAVQSLLAARLAGARRGRAT